MNKQSESGLAERVRGDSRALLCCSDRGKKGIPTSRKTVRFVLRPVSPLTCHSAVDHLPTSRASFRGRDFLALQRAVNRHARRDMEEG